MTPEEFHYACKKIYAIAQLYDADPSKFTEQGGKYDRVKYLWRDEAGTIHYDRREEHLKFAAETVLGFEAEIEIVRHRWGRTPPEFLLMNPDICEASDQVLRMVEEGRG